MAQRRLSEATNSLSTISERLSSGQRINRASDDAAGLAIADSLRADARIRTQAIRNVNDGISLINIATGALTNLGSITTRIAELAEQAANGVYSISQRRSLDSEADALVREFNRIVASTKFNGRDVFEVTDQGIRIQGGVGLSNSYLLDLTDAFSRDVGAGSTSTSQTIALTNPIKFPELIDINNDGNLDIVGTVYSSGTISINLGNGDGTFAAAASLALNWATSIAVGDFNNDGYVDIIGGRGFGPSNISELFLGNGNGTFQASTSIASQTIGSGYLQEGDFNGDGNLDFMSYSTASGNLLIHIGNGNGTFQTIQTYAGVLGADQGGGDITPMDMNGDGHVDIVAHSGSSVRIIFGNGDGTFGAITTIATGLGVVGNHVKGDFDGDGIIDIVVGSTTGGHAHFLKGNGDGTFSVTDLDFFNNFYVDSTGDYNNDGHLDFGVGTHIYHGNGDGTFTLAFTTGGADVGDFNNDGVLDFLTGQTTSTLTVLLQNTTDSTQMETFNLNTQENALAVLDSISNYRERISQQLGIYGSYQSRMGVGLANLRTETENILAAESRIRDADIATDAAEYVRLQILQQAAAAILSSANTIPEIALRLLSDKGGGTS